MDKGACCIYSPWGYKNLHTQAIWLSVHFWNGMWGETQKSCLCQQFKGQPGSRKEKEFVSQLSIILPGFTPLLLCFPVSCVSDLISSKEKGPDPRQSYQTIYPRGMPLYTQHTMETEQLVLLLLRGASVEKAIWFWLLTSLKRLWLLIVPKFDSSAFFVARPVNLPINTLFTRLECECSASWKQTPLSNMRNQ